MDDLDRLLDTAFAAAEAGNFAEAEWLCRRVLDLEPREFDATFLLGIVAGETGRAELAETMLRQAIAIDPSVAEAYRRLGAQLGRSQKSDEAIAALAEAIRLEPETASAYHDLGVIRLEAGRLDEAIENFQKALARDAGLAIGHYHLGYAHELHGDDQQAIASYRKALALRPDMVEAQYRLAPLLHATGYGEESSTLFRRVIAADPDSTSARTASVRLLMDEGNVDAAERYLSDALAHDPNIASLHHARGNCLQQLGRFAEANECFERAIGIDRNLVLAYVDLVKSRKVTENDRSYLDRMADFLADRTLSDRTRTALSFALGKAFDDLGEHRTAVGHFDEGNKLKRRFCAFDAESMTRFVDLSIAALSADFVRRSARQGHPSDVPILIIGMPRSGTTLVEQILSSHPEVGAGGELLFWSDCITRLGGLPTDRLAPETVAGFAHDYLALLSRLAPGKPRVTDKLPDNFRFASLIHSVFPNARIIHCRRDPIDTALSIYFTQFGQKIDYAYDRADIVAMYRQYLRLVAHWRAILPPDRFLDINYEEIVGDPEPSVRSLLDFCGLGWNEACLRPEDNDRLVKTASLWQARQPVYKSSVQRWKRYEPWLGVLGELAAEDEMPINPRR